MSSARGSELREHLGTALEKLEQLLERVPAPIAGLVKDKLARLRRLLVEQRPPALALVGRRGSGKSSLINALCGREVRPVGHVKSETGKAAWQEYASELGTLSILDTRGLQEGSPPAEADEAESPMASIKAALEDRAPDAVLFLVKASEVDAAIDADLDALEEVRDFVKKEHGHSLPLLAVVTQCDWLEPKTTRLHQPDTENSRDLEEKLEHVRQAERHVEDKLRARPRLRAGLVRCLGVSSYMSWRDDGSLRSDERWRIEELATFLLQELPEQAQLEFVRLTQVAKLQRELAATLTHATSGVCAGIAVTPIPVADIAPLTALQAWLVMAIGWLGGRGLSVKTAAEFLVAIGANVGVGYALREVARALLKVVAPGLGNVISGGIAFAGTEGIGRAASRYFIDGATAEEARKAFVSRKRAAEAEHEAEEAGGVTAGQGGGR